MSQVMRSNLFRWIVLLVACATLSVAAFAQSTVTGAVAGTVVDPSKAVVVGAKVTVRNVETNSQAAATTDSQGKFRVANLAPGVYSVLAETANFSPSKVEKVIVEVGRITELELAMNIAGKTETVQVTGEAPVVNTMQQDFSTNLNTESISNLPINGRRWSQYALLTPGATPDGNFGLISFRGISGLLNNNTVDGGDNNQAFFSEERGRTRAAYVVSQSSVREFQVNTSNYSAEYGRAAGAVVNSVTKSGTNSLHGEAFWYIRDNAVGATNPFWTQATQNADGTFSINHFKPEDRRQQFGGNVGGPILKDKLFFFFNYDGQRRNFPGVGVPGNVQVFFQPFTAAELTTLTARGVTSADASKVMGLIAANTGQTPRRGDQDIFFPKIDWRINDKHTASFSYNRMRWNSPAGVQTQPTVNYAIDAFGNDGVKDDIVIGRLSSALSNTISNELRFTWGRDFEFQSSQDPVGFETALATGYGNRPPNIYISSGGGLNMGRSSFLERAKYPDETRSQWSDTVNLAKGKHFIKFGADLSRNVDTINNLYNGGGAYSYSNRVDFISDYLKVKSCGTTTKVGCYSSFTQAFGPSGFSFENWDYALFLQDDIRLKPRLTLSIGMRWELEKMPAPQIPNPALPMTQKFHTDRNNFGPRFGFAYDMFGDGKTSLRGGYGVYYGRIINAAIFNAISQTGMPNAQVSYTLKPTDAGASVFPNVLAAPAGSTAKPSIMQFSDTLQAPQIHQADLVLEHEVAKNTVVSVSYLLSLGRELPQYTDVNIARSPRTVTLNIADGPLAGQQVQMPIFTSRLNNNFGQIVDVMSNINSNYNALVLQFNRRMTNGLQFQSSYTWSHALDYGQGSVTSATGSNVFDPSCLACEYGTSNFDIRHRIVGSLVYQPQMFKDKSGLTKAVLNGWSLAPVLTYSSGVPFDARATGYVAGTVNRINGGNGPYSRMPGVGRNSFRYPWIQNIDLRLSRSFKLTERQKVEFLAEAFNLFNTQQITGINTNMYTLPNNAAIGANNVVTSPMTYDPTFGGYNQAGATLYRERNVQFGIKYAF